MQYPEPGVETVKTYPWKRVKKFRHARGKRAGVVFKEDWEACALVGESTAGLPFGHKF